MWVGVRGEFFKLITTVLVAACLLPFGARGTEADVWVSMPFSCGVDQGHLSVIPSSDETRYRVVGPRRERSFTACRMDPLKTRICRSMMVHRFDIICGGTRVAWMGVAAKIRGAGIGRSWVENGCLNLVLAPRGARRRLRETGGDERNGLWAHFVLPPGFAPVGEAGARFVFGAVPVADDGGAGEEVLLVVDAGATDLSVAHARGWGAVVTRGPVPVGLAAVGGDEGGVLRSRSSIAMGIVALLLCCVLVMIRRSGRSVPSFGFVGSARQAEARMPPSAGLSDSRFSGSFGIGQFGNGARSVCALGRQTEVVVAGLSDAPALRETLEQELSSVQARLATLSEAQPEHGKGNSKQSRERKATVLRNLIRDLERIRRIAESARGRAVSDSGGLVMPRTKGEAFDVLGLSPGVLHATAKKVVDGLRMCWHPDHSVDAGDCASREERIKQINIAWELIRDDTAKGATRDERTEDARACDSERVSSEFV